MGVTAASLASTRSTPFKAVVWAGLLVGVLDGLDAVVYFGLASGIRPGSIFRYICSGLLGREVCHTAWYSVALGVALHFVVALGAAAVFSAASLWIPALLRKPFLWGPVYGICVYLFMSFVVVPLSLVPKSSGSFVIADLVNELFAHTILVGLPIALIVSHSSRVNARLK